MGKMKKKIVVLLVVVSIGIVLTWQGLRRKEKPAPYVTVMGLPVAGRSNGHTLEVIRALKEDVPLRCIALRAARNNKGVPREIRPLLTKTLSPKSKVVLVNEPLWSPSSAWFFQSYISKIPEKKLRIAYSEFHATAIPHEWVFILNEYFDAVVVPNMFVADVYEKSGVSIPIFEIPAPMDLGPLLELPMKKNKGDPMVFANFAPCEERSNHMILISAFAKAFGNRKDVLLNINTVQTEPFLRKFLQWEIDDLGLQNVHLTELHFDEEAYFGQFSQADCYVSLSKGEGFAYQAKEAMAIGIPVIVTNNTAQTGLCESGFVKSISSNKVQPARHHALGNVVCGKFFNCEANEVAAALLDVHDNYEAYLEKAQAGRAWVESYDYSNLKQLYLNLVKPAQVILGDENKVTPEYLMTNSTALYAKYQSL